MKKILSLLILLSFFIIGFIHNSMISFAMERPGEEGTVHCCTEQKSTNNTPQCLESCCSEKELDHGLGTTNGSFIKKTIKIACGDIGITRCTFSISSGKNKNLIKKTLPPLLVRNIENYSYHTLTHIIKSNT